MTAEDKMSLEKKMQQDFLFKARDTIKKYYPDMTVELVYYDEHGLISRFVDE